MEYQVSIEDYHLALLLKKLKKERGNDDGISLLLKLNIVLVVSSLTESIVNKFLAYESKSATEFTNLERTSLFQKCTESPKKYLSSYDLCIEKTRVLQELIAWRKAYVHSKPKLSDNGVDKLSGNIPENKIIDCELVDQFLDFPLHLASKLNEIRKDTSPFSHDYICYKNALS